MSEYLVWNRSRVFDGVVSFRLEIIFSSEIFKLFFRETHFRKALHLFTFCLYWWSFEFAVARGCPASVSDHAMRIQDYIKVEHVGTCLLTSSLAKFQQFWPECFFSFFLVYLFQVTSSVTIVAFRGRVIYGVVSPRLEVYIFSSEVFQRFFFCEGFFRKVLHFLYFCL